MGPEQPLDLAKRLAMRTVLYSAVAAGLLFIFGAASWGRRK